MSTMGCASSSSFLLFRPYPEVIHVQEASDESTSSTHKRTSTESTTTQRRRTTQRKYVRIEGRANAGQRHNTSKSLPLTESQHRSTLDQLKAEVFLRNNSSPGRLNSTGEEHETTSKNN